MDRLQEPLHDTEEPMQTAPRLPSDRSTPMVIDENGRSLYGKPSKMTDISRRLPSTNRTLDPIKRLPPELATLFIRNALPPHGFLYLRPSRSSRLIELTTISKKWQSFLCATPVLWSELVIDERQEDFLAALSIYVALSGKVALKLTFPRKPVDWTGLASLLLPVTERITRLSFEGYEGPEISSISPVITTVFQRLDHLRHLKEVNFHSVWGGGNLLPTASLLLPSTMKFEGSFPIEIPKSCQISGTPDRIFDIVKYNTFTNLEPIVPASNSLDLQYDVWLNNMTIRSNNATLSQLTSLAERLAEHHCFEQLVRRTACHLQDLDIYIHLSQVQDTIDCLRLLMCLQNLTLDIEMEDHAKDPNWAPISTMCCDLKVLSVYLRGDDVPGIVFSAQRTLHDLFSAFETLYPSVEDFQFYGHTWPFFASSYLQNLQALTSLDLQLDDSKYNPPEGYINLHSLQYLKIDAPLYFDSLHTPNLLRLSLYLPNSGAWPTHLSHRHIHSLVIESLERTQEPKVLSLDCTNLRHVRLNDIPLGATRGILSLSNVVSITLTFQVGGFVNPSSNQLCLAMLCHPEQLPVLQQLRFHNIVDWDVLFLMLQRRNIGEIGVKRIDTVSLPFIPFALQQTFTCLLAGEIVELPSLASLSVEATREAMFDSTVPGCFACLRCMRPGCTRAVTRRSGNDRDMPPADVIYPREDNATELAPAKIRDWLSLRSNVLDIWRASYEEFRQEFVRGDACVEFRQLLYL